MNLITIALLFCIIVQIYYIKENIRKYKILETMINNLSIDSEERQNDLSEYFVNINGKIYDTNREVKKLSVSQEDFIIYLNDYINLENFPTFDSEITAYCACYKCCGKKVNHPEYGITSSGYKVKENYTIAMDSKFPFGTKVFIEGFSSIFTVEDRGGAINGNRIDVYMKSHNDCINFGRQNRKVWILEWGEVSH